MTTYLKFQLLSKENILQKIPYDLCNIIDNYIMNANAIIIQKYFKKYLQKYIKNLMTYVKATCLFDFVPSTTYYNNVSKFYKLFTNKKMNAISSHKCILKCKCCNEHKIINSKINQDVYISYTINLETDCDCDCSDTALLCLLCTDEENYVLDM